MRSTLSRSTARRVVLAAFAGLFAATGIPTSGSAGTTASKVTYVEISRPMALPGVVLDPGSYTFEVANPGSGADVVLVRGGASPGARYLGFARRVPRPRDLAADQALTVGEAPAGEPIPITAWFPIGYASGYAFIYR